MPKKELTVERSSREVIEHKLLVALEEESGQVAIVATEEDLDLLTKALDLLDQFNSHLGPKASRMAQDLRRLKKEAFGA